MSATPVARHSPVESSLASLWIDPLPFCSTRVPFFPKERNLRRPPILWGYRASFSPTQTARACRPCREIEATAADPSVRPTSTTAKNQMSLYCSRKTNGNSYLINQRVVVQEPRHCATSSDGLLESVDEMKGQGAAHRKSTDDYSIVRNSSRDFLLDQFRRFLAYDVDGFFQFGSLDRYVLSIEPNVARLQ